MSTEIKIREGLELMGTGDKALNKKTFFGGKKPDYDAAAQAFEQAANAFKLGRAYDQAAEAFSKAAESHACIGSLFMAAKAMEQAATLSAQHLKRYPEAGIYYQRTSNYYLAHGSTDRAAECLEKAAKALETVDLEKSIEYYMEACSTYEHEDKLRVGVDTFKRAISMLVRNKRFDKALELSNTLSDILAKIDNKNMYFKNALATVIITLAFGDEVEANKKLSIFSTTPGFLESDEAKTIHDMLDAYENRDADLMASCQKRPVVTFLDNEIARLAMSLKVPGGAPTGASSTPGLPSVQNNIEEEGLL